MIRISYWGSPGISAILLEKLINSPGIKVEYVVTQQDKPRSNRGRELMPTPVKETAIKNIIPVFTPVSLKKKSDQFFEEIQKIPVDVNVVFAYGKIIPERFFNLPPSGTVNFHASLLPKLRGASPIEHALLEGFSETGWTMQKMVEELDAGDIYYTHKTDVNWNDDFFSLAEKLMKELLGFASEILKAYTAGALTGIPQDEQNSTHCGKIETAAGKINWTHSFEQIRNLGRAMTGRGGIYTFFNQKKIKLTIDLGIGIDQMIASSEKSVPGQIYKIDENHIWIECGDGKCLPVSMVQPDGKKKITVKEFINGYRIKPGDSFTP